MHPETIPSFCRVKVLTTAERGSEGEGDGWKTRLDAHHDSLIFFIINAFLKTRLLHLIVVWTSTQTEI